MPPRFPVGADAITEPDPRLLAQMQGQQAPMMGARMGVAGAFQGAGALTPSPIAEHQRVLATPAMRESMMRQATPRSAPTAPADSEALPVAPLATAPTRPQQGPGRHQAAGPGTPEQAHDAMRNLLQGKFQEMGMVVDDARLEELTKFAVSKRKGRMAKQLDKQSKGAISKYYAALAAQDNAERSFIEHNERSQSAVTGAIADKDEQKQLHYRDQLQASKSHWEYKKTLTQRMRQHLKDRYKIDPKDLADPVSISAYTGDDEDHDYSQVIGDDDQTP